MNAADVASIVWAETKALQPDVGEAGARLDALREMLARLVVSREGEGFTRKESAPEPTDPLAGGAGASIRDIAGRAATEVAAGAQHPNLILWPSTDRGRPAGPPPPPPPWDTASANVVGRFKADGRVVYAFSRDAGARGEKPFVSAVTGTGTSDDRPLPSAIAVAAPVDVPPPPAAVVIVGAGTRRIAFWLAMASIVVFIGACIWALSVGAAARANYGEFQQVLAEKKTGVPSANLDCAVGANADDISTVPPAWRQRPTLADPAKAAEASRPEQLPNRTDCRGLWAYAQSLVLKDELADPFTKLWRRLITSVSAGIVAGTLSIRVPMLVLMLSLVMLIVAAGLGVLGRPFGIFIDERNRMSLTRVQLALWTTVLIGGLTTLALFNVGFGITMYQDLAQLGALVGATDTESAVGRTLERFTIFPKMDWPFLALLGITTAVTPAASYLLMGRKSGPLSAGEARTIAKPEEPKVLHRNPLPRDAALRDLVTSERAEDAGAVDVTRVQHVAMSGLLAVTFASMLLESATRIDAVRVVRAVERGINVFTSLPPIDSTFMTLLIITHGTLLAGKWMDAQQPPAARQGQ